MSFPDVAVLEVEPQITIVPANEPGLVSIVESSQSRVVVVESESPADVVIQPEPVTVVVVEELAQMTISASLPEISIIVVPGLPGRDGAPGMGTDHTVDTAEVNASENIPALKFITAGGEVADSSNLAHFNHVVGLVMEDTDDGFVATAVVEGEVTDLSWSWTANTKLFLNGTTLSTTPPSSGFNQLVGITRNSSTVFIRLQIPVKL